MVLSRVFSFDDPSACQLIFPSADVEMFPTVRGTFHADVTQIGINGIWLHRIHIALPEIDTVAVKPGRRLIGFLTECNSSSVLTGGLDVRPGDIVVNRSDVVHQRTDGDFHYGTVSLSSDHLDAAAEAILGHGILKVPYKPTVRPSPALMLQLLNIHKGIGLLAHDNPGILELPEVGRALENELTHVLVRCLDECQSAQPTSSGRRHETILSRFAEFVQANPNRPLYVAEICAAIGAAERTLRASCEEHLGMGPIRYLALRRMHLVRRALRRSDSHQVTVTQIATDHGFWELGRFAVAYRTLFGESPSETLRQPSCEIARQPVDLSFAATGHA